MRCVYVSSEGSGLTAGSSQRDVSCSARWTRCSTIIRVARPPPLSQNGTWRDERVMDKFNFWERFDLWRATWLIKAIYSPSCLNWVRLSSYHDTFVMKNESSCSDHWMSPWRLKEKKNSSRVLFLQTLFITFSFFCFNELMKVCYRAETKLNLPHSSKINFKKAPKRPFSWFSSGNKVSVNSARRQKDLFSPLRSAIIWKVEVHALNRILVSCVAARMSAPPTAQHGSSKLPSLPPATGAARHRLASASSDSFQVFVFGSACLGYTLGCFEALRE